MEEPEAPAAGNCPKAEAADGGCAWAVVFHFFLVSREQAQPNPPGAGEDGKTLMEQRMGQAEPIEGRAEISCALLP